MADIENTTTLQNEIDKLKETKADIKQAIIDMNQTVTDTDTFNSYATKIKNISSDADASASDIANGKTAYVNGKKVTGTIPEILSTSDGLEIGNVTEIKGTPTAITKPNGRGTFILDRIAFHVDNDNLLRNGAYLKASEWLIADAINLTGDKIVKGNTILGIGGTTLSRIKGTIEYDTIDDMNADLSQPKNTVAIVHKKSFSNYSPEVPTQYITFPDKVTLPHAVTTQTQCSLNGDVNDTNASYDIIEDNLILSSTNASFYISVIGILDNNGSDSFNFSIEYTSTDGINYTRISMKKDNEDLSNPVDFKCRLANNRPGASDWNDTLGYFMQVENDILDIYMFNGTSWDKCINKSEISDTTATADDITSGKTAYINGEKVIGTMSAIKGVVNYDTVDLLKADTTQKANTIGIVQTINENNEITDVLVYKFDGTNWVSMGIDGGVLTNEEYINSTNTANTILGETTSTSTDTETTNIDTTTNS